LFSIITLQLFNLQVLSHSTYEALAAGQHDIIAELAPSRGQIYVQDPLSQRTTFPVAVNQLLHFVYTAPKHVVGAKATAAALAPLLGQEADELEAIFGKVGDPWEPLQHGVGDEAADAIEALALPGIYVAPEESRLYTAGPLFSQLVGFVGYNPAGQRTGQYGVEGYWDKQLAGTVGELKSEKDPAGSLITLGQHTLVPAVDGDNVVLTIDKNVQTTACGALERAVTKHGAQGGSVIVLDPATGAVRALCNTPGFDPNHYAEVKDLSQFGNVAVSAAYEPGSVFKAITMAAALNEAKLTPDTTYVDTGEVKIGPNTIKNSDNKAHGVQTMTQVLDESLNTGAIFAMRQVGAAKFIDYVKRFGFGVASGIELPHEAAGNLSSLNKRGEIYPATASFGQGITATVLQLASAFAAIGNKGKLMQPYVVQEVQHADGRVEVTSPTFVRQVVTPEVARTLSAMLVSVVELGHGKRAGVPGYYVAGKTGTAQVSAAGGGYDPNKTIGTFAGFGPVDSPKFAMVVRVSEPKDVVFAESSAAPVFGEVAKFLLQYYQVPPTRPLK
jgi:cell division protein FtsI/penicillin-binding protein 2